MLYHIRCFFMDGVIYFTFNAPWFLISIELQYNIKDLYQMYKFISLAP